MWLVGASSGIGRAVAAQLHAQGAQVIVSARQQALLDAFVQQHPGSQALALDVTDAQAVAARCRITCKRGAAGLGVLLRGPLQPHAAPMRWPCPSCCATSK